MPLDSSLALQLKPIELPSPVESAAKVYSLRNLINQGQMQELQMEQGKMTLEQARTKAAQDAELVNAVKNMTPEQAKDPAFVRSLMLRHASPSDLAKYLAEERASQKPQFAPRQSPGYFQNGKWVPTPENQVAPPQQPSPLARAQAELAAMREEQPA